MMVLVGFGKCMNALLLFVELVFESCHWNFSTKSL